MQPTPRRTILVPSLACVAALILASTAGAQLNGQTLTAQWRYPSFGSVLESHTVTVGPGVELPASTIINDFKFDIDIGNDSVEFRFNAASNWTNATYNGWYFHDTNGTIPAFTGYQIDSFSAGVTGTSNIVTGFTADEFYADFGGMSVAGAGDWIRMKVISGFSLSVSGLVAGGTATVSTSGGTPNGQVGIAYSLTGPGPSSANAGPCGVVTANLSAPITVLGVFTNDGSGNASTSAPVPAGTTGVAVWLQALDLGSCTLSNSLALIIG